MKLSLDALKERAEATASTELLATISGGTANACHPKSTPTRQMPDTGSSLVDAILILLTW